MLNEAIYIYTGIIVFLISVFFINKNPKKRSQSSTISENIAVFKHNKASGITITLSGIFLIGLFVFIGFKDANATLYSLSFGLVLGTIFVLTGIGFLLFNLKAFFHIENGHIKGKYHWFGKIDCNVSDVTFAVWRINTLIVQLNSGKTHTVTGIENSWQLASVIRRNMPFDVTEQPAILIEKLNNLKSVKKKGLLCICSGFALLFINIFITVFLTGAKEMHKFSKTDWIVFAIMGAIEIAVIIAIFCLAQKTGKNSIQIEKLHYEIQRKTIEMQPLLPGFLIAVYTDDNYTCRITLFGYPHDSAVYYSLQKFDSEYNLVHCYTSEIFENQEALSEGLLSLIDITGTVPH